tara:strand:+ start:9939 stop:10214 length:276 start_codon:yes stop_codon:yes gene_type:complete
MSDEKKQDDNLIHWHCSKCNIRIGVIDILEKQIRIRYKDLVMYYHWKEENGNTDKLTILCRRCGWLNDKSKEELHQLSTESKKIGYNKQKS